MPLNNNHHMVASQWATMQKWSLTWYQKFCRAVCYYRQRKQLPEDSKIEEGPFPLLLNLQNSRFLLLPKNMLRYIGQHVLQLGMSSSNCGSCFLIPINSSMLSVLQEVRKTTNQGPISPSYLIFCYFLFGKLLFNLH